MFGEQWIDREARREVETGGRREKKVHERKRSEERGRRANGQREDKQLQAKGAC